MLVGLVRAAGAAAAVRVRVAGLVLDLERVPAAAPGGRVRVVDREPALEAVDEVDLGAGQVRSAERIDDDPDAVRLELVVALHRAAVEAERVLEAGAPAALDGDAKNLGLAGRLLAHQVAHLRGRSLGERDDRDWAFGDLQGRPIVAARPGAAVPRRRGVEEDFVTPDSRFVERFLALLVQQPRLYTPGPRWGPRRHA